MRKSPDFPQRLGAGGLLWLSFTLNIYFLLLQPQTVVSLRRLALSAALAAVISGLLVMVNHRRGAQTGLKFLSLPAWQAAAVLAFTLYLILPAPRLHLFVSPAEVSLSFQPQQPGESRVQVIWLTNGLGDISFADLQLPQNAEITPQGVVFSAGDAQPAEIKWRGRIWRQLQLTLRSDHALHLTAQIGSQQQEIEVDGGEVERTIQLSYFGFGYYGLIYLLVIGIGSLSLAWLWQIGINIYDRTKSFWDALTPAVERYAPVVALLGITVFYVLTLRSGHKWGDDFAQYIAHARNLVEGAPYSAIGILHNPAVVLGPTAYPPLFPLLLAPLYALFGLNLTAFKIPVLLCSLASLWIFNLWLRPRFRPSLRALALLLVGLHPWYWNFKDQILSDMPFVLFCLLTILLYDRQLRNEGNVDHPTNGWLIGLTVSAAIATRSVGVILWAALLLDGLLHRRWRKRWFWPAALLPAVVLVVLNLLLPSTGDYLSQTRGWDWNILQQNLIAMLSTAFEVWRSDILLINGISLIALVGSVLFLTGFGSRLKQIRLEEWFFLGTLAMILVWPHPQGFRFYLPIYFLFIFYVLEGWRQIQLLLGGLSSGLLRGVGTALSAVLLIMVGVAPLRGYWQDYRHTPLHAFPVGIGLQTSEETFSYVQENMQPDKVIAFFKPRALAMMTGKTAFAPYWETQQPELMLEDLAAFGADYLLVWKPGYAELSDFARDNAEVFWLEFENEDFDLFLLTGLAP